MYAESEHLAQQWVDHLHSVAEMKAKMSAKQKAAGGGGGGGMPSLPEEPKEMPPKAELDEAIKEMLDAQGYTRTRLEAASTLPRSCLKPAWNTACSLPSALADLSPSTALLQVQGPGAAEHPPPH